MWRGGGVVQACTRLTFGGVCGLLWDGLNELVGNVGQWCQLPPMRLVCLDVATWWLMELCVLTKGGRGGEHVARLCGDSWCGCGHG